MLDETFKQPQWLEFERLVLQVESKHIKHFKFLPAATESPKETHRRIFNHYYATSSEKGVKLEILNNKELTPAIVNEIKHAFAVAYSL